MTKLDWDRVNREKRLFRELRKSASDSAFSQSWSGFVAHPGTEVRRDHQTRLRAHYLDGSHVFKEIPVSTSSDVLFLAGVQAAEFCRSHERVIVVAGPRVDAGAIELTIAEELGAYESENLSRCIIVDSQWPLDEGLKAMFEFPQFEMRSHTEMSWQLEEIWTELTHTPKALWSLSPTSACDYLMWRLEHVRLMSDGWRPTWEGKAANASPPVVRADERLTLFQAFRIAFLAKSLKEQLEQAWCHVIIAGEQDLGSLMTFKLCLPRILGKRKFTMTCIGTRAPCASQWFQLDQKQYLT